MFSEQQYPSKMQWKVSRLLQGRLLHGEGGGNQDAASRMESRVEQGARAETRMERRANENGQRKGQKAPLVSCRDWSYLCLSVTVKLRFQDNLIDCR